VISSVVSDPPFVRDLKLSGFNPSTGIISFANDSQDPWGFPKFFIGIGSTSFATDSSSQQDCWHESLATGGVTILKIESDGTATLVKSGGGVTTTGFGVDGVVKTTGGVGRGVDGVVMTGF